MTTPPSALPTSAAHPCADLGVELAELGGVLEVVRAERRGRRGECADRALDVDVTERREPAWFVRRVLRVLGPDPRPRQPADERRDDLGREPRIVGERVAQGDWMHAERSPQGRGREAREWIDRRGNRRARTVWFCDHSP